MLLSSTALRYVDRKERVRYKIVAPTREDWTTGPTHVEIWFTDGSKTQKGVGTGLCGQQNSTDSLSPHLNWCNTIFQTEVLAIKCIDEYMADGKISRTLWICSNSTKGSLKKPTTHTMLQYNKNRLQGANQNSLAIKC